MLVFIDESGDPGFRVEEGASPIFVAAMVIFAGDDDAARTQQAIAASQARRMHKPEFKFSSTRPEVRDAYFSAVRGLPFKVRAIVVRKDRIRSPHLRADKETFYQFFVRTMMRFDNDVLQDARVVIDGSGDREFRHRLASTLRNRLADGAVKSVRFKDSKRDPLLQLADMCAGAIARSFRDDRPEPWRWRRMLVPRIDDVWPYE